VRAEVLRWVTLAVIAGCLAGAGPAWAQRSVDEAILPLAEYRAQDVRGLAETYLEELRAVYQSVRRCLPEVDFHHHGLGFRRPLGIDGLPPYLAAWVWIPGDAALPSEGLGARATEAFRRYAPRMLPQLVARQVVHADARVGGYGLVLTWIKPGGADPPIAETLVVFLPKGAATLFVSGTATFTELLAGARIRAFDGQTEVKLAGLGIPGGEAPVLPAPC
jgi:hypothetical protein